MKKRGIAQKIGLLSFILLVLSITFSCEKEAINKTSSEGGTIGNTTTTTTSTTSTGNTTVIPNTSFNPYGIWQRFGSPKLHTVLSLSNAISYSAYFVPGIAIRLSAADLNLR